MTSGTQALDRQGLDELVRQVEFPLARLLGPQIATHGAAGLFGQQLARAIICHTGPSKEHNGN